jgi:hypothetical protein
MSTHRPLPELSHAHIKRLRRKVRRLRWATRWHAATDHKHPCGCWESRFKHSKFLMCFAHFKADFLNECRDA